MNERDHGADDAAARPDARDATLRHYRSLDRLSRVIAQAHDLEGLIGATLETVLDVFGCDRAWLLHPCDPEAPSWHIEYEATRPEWPGALAGKVEFPTDATARQIFSAALATREPLDYGVRRRHPWAGTARFDIQSELHVALRPHLGPAWLLGLHQCSYERDWSDDDVLLFREVAQRLSDALTNLLHTRALAEREANFRAIADNARIAIFLVSADGESAYANQDACELSGYGADELAHRSMREVLDLPDDGPTTEGVVVRRDGTRVPVEARRTTTTWQGRAARLLLVRDIRERLRRERDRAELLERERRARAEAERANHAKDDFLAIVSHELRTPLTTVLVWAQLLRQGKLDAAGTTRAAETIERAGRAQAQIVDDLLDVTRILSGKLVFDRAPLDPSPIVLAVVESLRPSAEKKKIRLSVSVDPSPLCVESDSTRLSQMVWNVVGNAIKFTPEHGAVDVRLAAHDGACTLTVRDTGKGFSPEFRARIFDPFAQADTSSTRAEGGLGLGLAIVHAIAELHGGHVDATSDGEKKGATFTVTLPTITALEPLDRPEPARPSRTDTGRSIRGARVLVVDDDAETREAIGALLRSYGAEVQAAGSAKDALAAITSSRPDVVVSDIAMPGGDGYSLLASVRALDPDRGGRTPAIALTAYATSDDATRAIAAGFQRHLAKPVDADELADAIAEVLRSDAVR